MNIVHVGYPKTGTKFLQNCVFPYMDGVEYVGYWESMKTLRPVFSDTTLEFNPSKVKIRPGLYSSERLVGEMGLGTYNYEIAQRLKDIGFDRVIIVVRGHGGMAESTYRQYVAQGGTMSAKDYFSDPDLFRWSYLDYRKLILRYCGVFGDSGVLVLFHEDILERPGDVAEQIREFCGAKSINHSYEKHNVSLSYWSTKLLRIINHFTYNHYRRSNLLSNRITTWKFRWLLTKIDPLVRRLLPERKFYK